MPISNSWIRKPGAKHQLLRNPGASMTQVLESQLRSWQHCSLGPSGQQRLMFLEHGVDLFTRSLQALCTIACVLPFLRVPDGWLQPAGSERVNRRADWRGTGNGVL